MDQLQKKAFDSVLHSWIMQSLDLRKVQKTRWKNTITLSHTGGQTVIPHVKIQTGIFQGDSLPPLLFCITVEPLSKILKKYDIGYNLNKSRGQKNS